jgi:hypothetical protein
MRTRWPTGLRPPITRDTGQGIREKQLAAIFEPFLQVVRPGDRGAGLGLTISRRSHDPTPSSGRRPRACRRSNDPAPAL